MLHVLTMFNLVWIAFAFENNTCAQLLHVNRHKMFFPIYKVIYMLGDQCRLIFNNSDFKKIFSYFINLLLSKMASMSTASLNTSFCSSVLQIITSKPQAT